MTKIQITALIAVVIALFGVTAGIALKEALVPQTFGAQPDSSVSTPIASSSATYFGTNEATRTATGTLLTVNNVYDSDAIALVVTNTATTTSAATVYIEVLASEDASRWYSPSLGELTHTGTPALAFTLNVSSTTLVVPAPASITKQAVFTFKEISARYLQFKVRTNGTSTVLLEAYKLSQ